MPDNRRLRYATDPEYRKKERERVAKYKTKTEFVEKQRKYNREYYHLKRKDQRWVIRRSGLCPYVTNLIIRFRKKFPNEEKNGQKEEPNDVLNSKVVAGQDYHVEAVDDPVEDEDLEGGRRLPESSEKRAENKPVIINSFQILSARTRAQDDQGQRICIAKEDKDQTQEELCKHLDIQIEYKCKKCFKRSLTMDEATRHARTHQQQPIYSCSLCPFTDSDMTQVIEHLRSHQLAVK